MKVPEYISLGCPPILDLRAPIEFESGHFPGSVNIPLLSNEERHLIGIEYKTKGQDAAIALGHTLVDPHREELIRQWKAFLGAQKIPLLTCFRGGLRSQTTQAWLKESGFEAQRLEGGTKALRQALLALLEKPLRGFVLAGLTGSGKTKFLRTLAGPQVIDLEDLANHRGSAFGAMPSAQPAQQSFENALAVKLLRANHRVILEDESRMIGKIYCPIFEGAQGLPRIFLETPFEERVRNIWEEYVANQNPQLQQNLEASLLSVKARMGGLAYQSILGKMRIALVNPTFERCQPWIAELLENYYDKLYRHSLPESYAFRGNAQECRAWLEQTNFFSAHATNDLR